MAGPRLKQFPFIANPLRKDLTVVKADKSVEWAVRDRVLVTGLKIRAKLRKAKKQTALVRYAPLLIPSSWSSAELLIEVEVRTSGDPYDLQVQAYYACCSQDHDVRVLSEPRFSEPENCPDGKTVVLSFDVDESMLTPGALLSIALEITKEEKPLYVTGAWVSVDLRDVPTPPETSKVLVKSKEEVISVDGDPQ